MQCVRGNEKEAMCKMQYYEFTAIPLGHQKGVALPWQRTLMTYCISKAFFVCFLYLQIYV